MTRLQLIAIILCLVGILAFKANDKSKTKEYLCITMQVEEDHPVFFISKSNSEVEKLVFLDPNSTRRYNFLKKDYLRKGYIVKEQSIPRGLDYNIAFEIIAKYESEGWHFENNSFSIAGYDEISNTLYNQFFFSRQ